MDEDEDDSMKSWPVGALGARFPPPPPRPPHLTIPVSESSPLTDTEQLECDLCSWARPHQKLAPGKETGENGVGWITTLVIVALASAAVTAIIMITLPRCWRKIVMNLNCGGRNANIKTRTGSVGEENRVVENETALDRNERSKKCPLPPAQNHYTHIERELNRTPAFLNLEGSNPSSAYYSELSAGDLTYETVDLHILPQRLLSRTPNNQVQPEYD